MKRPIHQLLTILRDNPRVQNNMVQEGLCLEVQYLSYLAQMISFTEAAYLDTYINENMPVRYMPDSNLRSGFGWPKSEWPPRFAWLNQHVELTRPKP